MIEQQVLSQIIDNQLMMLKKMDELIKITSNLTNTIIKYDEDYQEQIVKEVNK